MKALVTVLAVSTCVAAGSAAYLYSTRPRTAAVPAVSEAIQTVPPGVDARPAVAPTPIEHAEPIGRLEASSESDVRSNVGGYVLHVRIDPGDFVEKGQTLVEVENPTLEEPVRRAEATLELAKSDLEAQQLRLTNVERRRDEAFPGAGARSERRESAETLVRLARNEVERTRARVTQAEAALLHAKQAQGDSQIASSISGSVAERRVSVGDRITPGMVVARIVDTSTLKLAVKLTEADSSRMIPAHSQHALVTAEAFPDRPLMGKVISTSNSDRTAVSIEVANADRLLKPGMSAHVKLVSDSSSEPRLARTSRRYESFRGESRGLTDKSTDRSLLGEMLSSMKGLASTLSVAADAQAKELTRKREATQVTVEATTHYFEQLERFLVDLRPDSMSHHAVNLERTADQIDNLPILHVDEELLAFGAEVAQGLRMMAERRRSISRSRTYTDVTLSDEVQVENSAVRTQGMQKITIGLANMRRKMTKKYNLEFLANATNVHTATVSQRKRTTRR